MRNSTSPDFEGLAVHRIALKDDAVLGRDPRNGVGDAAAALDLVDDLLGDLQVLQPAPGADHPGALVARRRRAHGVVPFRSLPARDLLDDESARWR